jgi:multiple sugar transport system substrate-binding protein
MAVDKIVNPSNAEYAKNESQADFANRKAAMLLWQAAGTAFQAQGMKPEEYGVAPVPFLATPPTGSKRVNSMVAGINMAVFRHSRNLEGAMEFVKFMTSDEEQIKLNKTYGSLPSVKSALSDPAFQAPEQKVLAQVLGSTAAPLPQVTTESQFETLVGSVMKELFANAANNKPITEAGIRSKLKAAEQRMKG